jgi:hypothetical protein
MCGVSESGGVCRVPQRTPGDDRHRRALHLEPGQVRPEWDTDREQKAPLTQQRPLESLLKAAAFPNSDTLLVLVAMQQLLASHREWDGYRYFGRLAQEQPNRRALFLTLQATMQARVAGDVSLFRRVAWVEDAIRKLDAGAAAEPLLGHLARGLVFADLPLRFGKARQAIEDLEWCLVHRPQLPLGLDRGIYRGLAAAYLRSGDERRSQEMLARAGLGSLDDRAAPDILGNLSVDAARGFRFGEKRLVREAEGVYVAQGYDFSNLAFIVAPTFVVARQLRPEREAGGAADRHRAVSGRWKYGVRRRRRRTHESQAVPRLPDPRVPDRSDRRRNRLGVPASMRGRGSPGGEPRVPVGWSGRARYGRAARAPRANASSLTATSALL